MTPCLPQLDVEELDELRSAIVRAMCDGVASTRRCWEEPAAWKPLWESAVQLDLPGLIVPERLGGSGAGVSTLIVVLEAVGRTLAPIPLRSTAAVSVSLLSRIPGSGPEEVLRQIATGSTCTTADVADWNGMSDNSGSCCGGGVALRVHLGQAV